jgi:hypothetical protein
MKRATLAMSRKYRPTAEDRASLDQIDRAAKARKRRHVANRKRCKRH